MISVDIAAIMQHEIDATTSLSQGTPPIRMPMLGRVLGRLVIEVRRFI